LVIACAYPGLNACLPNVRFTQILGPVALPSGTYTIAIYGGGTGCTGGVALGPLDVSSMPDEIAAVFHTAAAPEVDLVVARAFGRGSSPETRVTGIPNGASLSTAVRAGNRDVALPAGGNTPAFGPVNVRVLPRTAYLMFACTLTSEGCFHETDRPRPGVGILGS